MNNILQSFAQASLFKAKLIVLEMFDRIGMTPPKKSRNLVSIILGWRVYPCHQSLTELFGIIVVSK